MRDVAGAIAGSSPGCVTDAIVSRDLCPPRDAATLLTAGRNGVGYPNEAQRRRLERLPDWIAVEDEEVLNG